jgi:hypothetical protein
MAIADILETPFPYLPAPPELCPPNTSAKLDDIVAQNRLCVWRHHRQNVLVRGHNHASFLAKLLDYRKNQPSYAWSPTPTGHDNATWRKRGRIAAPTDWKHKVANAAYIILPPGTPTPVTATNQLSIDYIVQRDPKLEAMETLLRHSPFDIVQKVGTVEIMEHLFHQLKSR